MLVTWRHARSLGRRTSDCGAKISLGCAKFEREAWPRAPKTKPRQSSKIDFPVPVSPVKALRPEENSKDNFSINKIS